MFLRFIFLFSVFLSAATCQASTRYQEGTCLDGEGRSIVPSNASQKKGEKKGVTTTLPVKMPKPLHETSMVSNLTNSKVDEVETSAVDGISASLTWEDMVRLGGPFKATLDQEGMKQEGFYCFVRDEPAYTWKEETYRFDFKPITDKMMAELCDASNVEHGPENIKSNWARGVLRFHIRDRATNQREAVDIPLPDYVCALLRKSNAKDFLARHPVRNWGDFLPKEQSPEIAVRDRVKAFIKEQLQHIGVEVLGSSVKLLYHTEPMLLRDLVYQLPWHLARLTKDWTRSLEIEGVAVGIQSHRNICVGCANVIRQVQWILPQQIRHWLKALDKIGVVDVAQPLPTMMVGVWQKLSEKSGSKRVYEGMVNGARKVSMPELGGETCRIHERLMVQLNPGKESN